MKALLVGAGGMGRAWGRNLVEEGMLAGWCDVRAGAANEAAAEVGEFEIPAGTDLSDLIDRVAPDFVVDVTIPEAHHDVTRLALARGLPVLGEKPMAPILVQARAMVEASERAGKLYMVSQSRRYDAGLVAFRRLVERLGPLGILHADFLLGAHFGGFRDEMANVLLVDMAIHTFDAARFLSGTDPVSVYAEEYNPSWSWYRGAACANCLFEMSSGLRFAYRGAWCAEGLGTSWDGDWRAVGPNGSASWARNGTPVAELVAGDEGFHRPVERIEEPPAPLDGGIKGSLREFVSALETGATPQGECHDNLKSLLMVFAAVESARRGERVWMDRL